MAKKMMVVEEYMYDPYVAHADNYIHALTITSAHEMILHRAKLFY
jgi:hypothetical protein